MPDKALILLLGEQLQSLFWEDSENDPRLLEIVMPDFDGIEFAKRCNEINGHRKAMLITGPATKTFQTPCLGPFSAAICALGSKITLARKLSAFEYQTVDFIWRAV